MLTKKYISVLILAFGLFISFSACSNDDEKQSPEFKTINQILKAGEILVTVEETPSDTYFQFEKTKISYPTSTIQSVTMNKVAWKTNLVFTNGEIIEIPTQGQSISIDVSELEVNPTGYSPLAAKLFYVSPVQGLLKMEIKSKKKEVPTITHVFPDYTRLHNMSIYGLYPDHENMVYFSLTDKEGNVRAKDSIIIKTKEISMMMPEIYLMKADTAKMEQGLTLISYIGDHELDTSRPFMIDAAGDVRWYLHLKSHPQLQNFAACSGLKRMENGNFLTASIRDGSIYELDMFGELIRSWEIASKGYEFHRDIIEIDNGNFLLAATNKASKNKDGNPAVLDCMIEVSRETGNIVTEWDFKESMDEKRSNYTDKYSATDWAHQNAIAFSPKDRTVIVSNRFQGVTKLDWSNKTQWMLSPHKGFGNNGRGEGMSQFLLTPLSKSGSPIKDRDIIGGVSGNDEFEWAWGPHCPVLMGDDRLLLFDNGYYRHFKDNGDDSYSRAVEYKIDEKGKTIQQTWDFGKELGKDGYSSIVSSVQYLEKTDHVLFGSGAVGFVGHGVHAQGGGRIVEVDYNTKEIVYDVRLQVPTFYVFHRVTRMPLYP